MRTICQIVFWGQWVFSLEIQPGRETESDLPESDSLLTNLSPPRSHIEADAAGEVVNYQR